MDQRIVSRAEWLPERLALLAEEKALATARDALAVKRRSLPLVFVTDPYAFATEAGPAALADLFAGKSQLIVYHFMYVMYGMDYAEG